jgi:membrane-bound serine protease (ClpP class)
MSIAMKARRNKMVSGAQGMIGETGVAQTPLSPGGKVFVHGEIWDAISSGEIPAGETVVVRRIDGLMLQVEPLTVGRTAPASR